VTYEQDLMRRYPEILWDKPVKVSVEGAGERWACRLCIAVQGLRASELDRTPFVFRDRAAAKEHVQQHSSVGV
jgi:hypothetical protein